MRKLDRNKEVLYSLIDSYFDDCKQNGYSDFLVWCEDNLENDEQESLAYELNGMVNAIAGLLFLD